MNRLRIWAYAAAVPSIVGVVILLGDNFDLGMLWLLLPPVASGLMLSQRFYPLQLSGTKATERMNGLWKRTIIDIGWLSGAYLVLLFAWAIAVQFIDTDGSVFGLAPLLALFAGGAALLGVLAGFLTVLPIVTLVQQAHHALRREPVDREAIAGALLLLSAIVFVVALVAATSIEGGSSRSRGWSAIFVLLTGLQSEDARITSEALAWTARIALIVLVASGFVFYRLARAWRRSS